MAHLGYDFARFLFNHNKLRELKILYNAEVISKCDILDRAVDELNFQLVKYITKISPIRNFNSFAVCYNVYKANNINFIRYLHENGYHLSIDHTNMSLNMSKYLIEECELADAAYRIAIDAIDSNDFNTIQYIGSKVAHFDRCYYYFIDGSDLDTYNVYGDLDMLKYIIEIVKFPLRFINITSSIEDEPEAYLIAMFNNGDYPRMCSIYDSQI